MNNVDKTVQTQNVSSKRVEKPKKTSHVIKRIENDKIFDYYAVLHSALVLCRKVNMFIDALFYFQKVFRYGLIFPLPRKKTEIINTD